MNTKRLHVLIIVLGLAMVWLGFLSSYELKKGNETIDTTNKTTYLSNSESTQTNNNNIAFTAGTTGIEKGFPILLAGLGIVFLAGGATSFRQYKMI